MCLHIDKQNQNNFHLEPGNTTGPDAKMYVCFPQMRLSRKNVCDLGQENKRQEANCYLGNEKCD